MRIHNDRSAAPFYKQLLDIGDGKMAIDPTSQTMKFTENFCNIMLSRAELIANVYPNIRANVRNHEWLSERAILAAKNVDVDAINVQIQDMLRTESVSFKLIRS